MVDVASRSMPSTDLRGPYQLGLDEVVRTKLLTMERCRKRTEADTRVLLTNILTLVVGEEHVSREATLGRVRI